MASAWGGASSWPPSTRSNPEVAMSDAESDAGDDQAAAITNIVQPLRKQAKKLASKLEKLDAVVKALEKERNVESERREGIERRAARPRG